MKIAAYARYSTDMQREASLEDQLRNCRNYCLRQQWPEPEIYVDAAISGTRNDRPGYQRMLAEAHRFDVILVDDFSRLARDSIESAQAVRRLVHIGVRLIGVSDGTDTAQKGYKIGVGLRGLMSELYVDDLAEKVHRGLTGRALSGASAGGLPYGYVVSGLGQRAIDGVKADVVRRIYADYIAGVSPRQLAANLNQEGVPSPRDGKWAVSAIYGDIKRGIGILANPIYVGRQIWNRSKWVKHPTTGRKVRNERPSSEWIITEHPELAIIDQATWDAAQKRIQRLRVDTRGASRHQRVGGPGRPPKHLLTGILRCECCGGPMVAVDYYRYGCAMNKDRGDAACPNRLRVPRASMEDALLKGIREEVLSESRFALFQREVQDILKRHQPDTQGIKRKLSEAARVRDNVLNAIRAGIITPSTKSELERAEQTVADAQQELDRIRSFQPTQVLPRLRERWIAAANQLADVARKTHGAREAIRELLGERVTVKNENGTIIAEVPPSCETKMVAGVGSVLYLTEPLRIVIKP